MSANWLRDLNLKSRSNSVKTFKSYVDFPAEEKIEFSSDSSHSESVNEADVTKESPHPVPSLLPGEVAIAQAENILKFNSLSELNKGISGLLICTNFKVSFLTAENFVSNLHQRNAFLGEHDICLINIDAVYQVINGKRKKLPVSCTSSNIEIIEICCKDFRIYTFSFKFSPVRQRSVINTIIHHAFVPKINLLFAFDLKGNSSNLDEADSHSLLYTRPCDWEAELERCRCPGWRVTLANEKFLLCESLPETFVVPSILLDMNLNKSAPHFAGHRVPTWTWGTSSGASIIRMASLDPSISDSRQKDVMVDAISRASPHQAPIRTFNLDETCPGYKELQNSFLKLKELCMPSTPNEYWDIDSHYLSSLESSKWLQSVSSCLKAAIEGARCILKDTTVILTEHEGRDLSAVVSSLIQIMLDPAYRTRSGFELLIQKEWIALGHPFTERHRLISGSETEESPVFLLFLDCVWQLTEQCPTVFEFSETFLTTLYDSCRISLYDTFLFSSHKCRTEALLGHDEFNLRSVWKWGRMFSEKDIRLFSNPLYILNNYTSSSSFSSSILKTQRPKSFSCLKDRSQNRPLVLKKHCNISPIVWGKDEENLLEIDPLLQSLKVWHQCFMRWIPLAHTLGGGRPVLFLSYLKVSAEIEALEREIKALSSPSHTKPPSRHRRVASDDYTLSAGKVDSSQIPEGSSILSSVFPFAPVAPWDWTSHHFVPSTSYLQICYTEPEEGLDE